METGARFYVDDDDPRLVAALIPYDAKDWDEARSLLTPLAEDGNLTAIFKLGCVWDALGDTDAALEWWTLADSHGESRSPNNLGRYWEDKGDWATAEVFFARSAEGGNPEAMFNLARVLGRRGDVDQEMQWLDRATEAGMERARTLKAIRFSEMGREDEAEATYAAGRAAGSRTAFQNSAQRAFDAGRTEEARDLLLEMFALEEDPRDEHMRVYGYALMGFCQLILGEQEDARRHLLMAANLGSEHAMKMLATLADEDGDQELHQSWLTMALAHGAILDDDDE